MNFIKKFLGSSPKDEIASISSGKLFLTRSPQSPKGELECLYNDAFACIRKSNTAFCYELCINRVYQEGELDLHGSSGFDDSDESDEDDEALGNVRSGTSQTKDEWTFFIVEELRLRTYTKSNGTRAISWMDLNGDIDDRFEFIVDEDVKSAQVDAFMSAIYKCLYEQKYHKSSNAIRDRKVLDEFVYTPEEAVIDFDSFKEDSADLAMLPGEEREKTHSASSEYSSATSGDEYHDSFHSARPIGDSKDLHSPATENNSVVANGTAPVTDDHKPNVRSDTAILYNTSSFDLFSFDTDLEKFIIQKSCPEVEALITKKGDWEYSLVLESTDKTLFLETLITSLVNPVFNFKFLSFIFNYIPSSKSDLRQACTLLLKFSTFEELSEFQAKFVQATWENINKKSWQKKGVSDYEYLVEALSDMSLDEDDSTREDSEQNSSEDEDDDDEDDDDNVLSNMNDRIKNAMVKEKGRRMTASDDEDDYDDLNRVNDLQPGEKNSSLSVGHLHDKAFVSRGNRIGVFGSEDGDLKFETAINDLRDSNKKSLNPDNMMLHMKDQYMIISDKTLDNKRLYKMDLNRGQLIEEWEIDKYRDVVSYGSNSKFAALTDEQTLIGLSSNGLFRIDPRLPDSKIVDDEATFLEQKPKFSSLATSSQGYIVVASKTGEIRLYNRLGKFATTLIPSLGEEIRGIDVSQDGRWVLATCKTYLLLIDVMIGPMQKNSGNLGFTRYFDKDKKPRPKRLTIKPEHVAYMATESGEQPLNFTKAYFNTGIDSTETSIITSTGPYLISWPLKKAARKKADHDQEQIYSIKRYAQNVVAENFKFGSSSNVVVTLENDVSLANRSSFRKGGKSVFLPRGK
ncbi:Piso0_005198 [Millerozyma farinosa CBS 7064]|uniref:Piso0_005198 protein n=1 Tax=Pichia sorbitophila (strain ATCC MYA-4447 / BCRC 22081 / CBS 7064 / NBRC 10061 / NRRL Y-12695) TaxID=559304 RepID=G8Y1J0_PICSO|nr:Piso0_005198 [Millerozyma farinosa CBS 7064]